MKSVLFDISFLCLYENIPPVAPSKQEGPWALGGSPENNCESMHISHLKVKLSCIKLVSFRLYMDCVDTINRM